MITSNGPCPNFEGSYSIAGNSGEFFNINTPDGGDWKILIEYVCVLSEDCKPQRCGMNGLARDMDAYIWLAKESQKEHIFGDVLIGLFAGVIILWFYWCIKEIFKKQ